MANMHTQRYKYAGIIFSPDMNLNDNQEAECLFFDIVNNRAREVTVAYKLSYISVLTGLIKDMPDWKSVLYEFVDGVNFEADVEVITDTYHQAHNIQINF